MICGGVSEKTSIQNSDNFNKYNKSNNSKNTPHNFWIHKINNKFNIDYFNNDLKKFELLNADNSKFLEEIKQLKNANLKLDVNYDDLINSLNELKTINLEEGLTINQLIKEFKLIENNLEDNEKEIFDELKQRAYLIRDSYQEFNKRINAILDINILKSLSTNKLLGSVKEKALTIKEIAKNDYIVFMIKYKNNWAFVGYTSVEGIEKNPNSLYNYYNSYHKLRLKGLKYFKKPIYLNDVVKEFEDYKNSKFEFKKISEKDFEIIFKKGVKDVPEYLKRTDMFFDDSYLDGFILNTIQNIYNILKFTEFKKLVEIKVFLKILHQVLKEYGINLSKDEVEEFYSKNVYQLEIDHVTGRESKQHVKLYNSTGFGRNFSYINLE